MDLSIVLQPALDQASIGVQALAAAERVPLLHFAAMEDDIAYARLALRLSPGCVNEHVAHLGTSLHIAVLKGSTKLVNFLLANGAHANAVHPAQDVMNTPLNTLLSRIEDAQPNTGCPAAVSKQVVRLLLQRGADPNIAGADGIHALIRSASFCDPDIVHLILDTGVVDINTVSNDGSSALHEATSIGVDDTELVVEALLQRGIDVNLVNDRGETALFEVQTGWSAQLLVAYGADVNAVDYAGMTVVHRVAGWSNEDCAVPVMEQLLAGRCRVRLGERDLAGMTAVEYAREKGNARIVVMLEAYQSPSL